MAFQNVNVAQARENLKNMEISLDMKNETEILEMISDITVFQTSASEPLITSITKMQGYFSNLKKKIELYLSVIDMMEEYKNYEIDVENIENSIERERNREEPRESKISRLKREKQEALNQMKDIIKKVDEKLT